MADQALSRTVLCEAMDYLSKLATNLGSRTESMKEKRINKSKLKDSQSVKSAAEKVLLLCELSKKSLENVEKSVKKIMEGAASNSGGKTPDVKKPITSSISPSPNDKHSFMHRNSKKHGLRMPKGVNIKHYKSVKVIAKSMPMNMLENYPVYINCKLYHQRRRLRKERRKKIKSSQHRDKSSELENNTNNMEQVIQSNNEKLIPDKDSSPKSEGNMAQNKKISNNGDSSNQAEISETKIASKDVNSLSEMKDSSKKSEEKTKQLNFDEVQDKECKSTKKRKIILESSDSDNVPTKEGKVKQAGLEPDSENMQHFSTENMSEPQNVNLECERDNAENPTDEDCFSIENDLKGSIKENTQSARLLQKPGLSRKSIDSQSRKKFRGSRDERNGQKCKAGEKMKAPNSKDGSVNDQVTNEITDLKQSEANVIELDSETEASLERECQKKDKKNGEEKENDSDDPNDCAKVEDTKPVIKCVSISKLLKPSVAFQELKEDVSKKQMVVHMKRSGELKTKLLEDKDKSCKQADRDHKYWLLKNEKVKNFVPKKFAINIIRLSPRYSAEFLNQHNVKRITQNGLIVFEALNEKNDTVNDEENDIESNKEGEKSAVTLDDSSLLKAKHALLNDSDEEKDSSPMCSPRKLTHETENVKKSLLNDSESDRNEEKEVDNGKDETEKVKKSLPNDSESDRNEENEVDNGKDETENVKKTLLNDSESDRNEKEEVNNGKKETENVKKSLSNDSECNRNEKKEVNNCKDVTKNVKRPLLNDSESDRKEEKEVNNGKTNSDECAILIPKSSSDPTEECSLDSNVKESTLQTQERNNSTPEKEYVERNDDQDKEDAKSALLNDSSDSSSKKDVQKRKRNENTKKSRRKNIMESMHAKKMLLTYSSSSDTEDEQLKNVIKDIKDTLLKDIVSDEEKTKKQVKNKILSSSDSDGDNFKPVKKKRKISRSLKPAEDTNLKRSDEKGNGDSEADKRSTSKKKMGRSREKQDGSGSNNSDIQEDKDIEGLTNLKSLNKSRPRRSPGANKAGSSRRANMAETPLITGEEGLVEAPSSSDADEVSDAESNAAEEELPAVSLSSLNGSALQHLAKEDLLGESESDSSKDKSSDNLKKEDDSDTEDIKAKRRKANAISSDSEAGSSRRKAEAAAKISDFEDSEDDSSDLVKNNKRKKKGTDSDASGGSSSEEGKKKRRRIKQINDSDGSGSDTENEGKSKHGRKNIRKVMGKNQLEEATKKAARQEKERLARIAERQKMYNNLEFDESGKPDEVILDKVVLDFDPETKEPLIEVDRGLVKKLKPHQANGIKFMWDACFESVKRIKKDKGSGCILAHCMGLGKTLQVVSLTHTLLTHGALTGVHRVLVVCPLSTVLNWVNEFRMWLKFSEAEYDVDVYELSRHKQNTERAFQLSQWVRGGGVCVLGYEMFRNLSADNTKKYKKKMLRQLQEALVDPGPDLVVCDEGHLLKNEKTSLSQSMNKVKTLRRIVLTGTPLQNNLKEYYCMVQFVKPNLLGKYNEYLNRFVNPITNGQYTDSTEQDIRVMKRRSHVLHTMLDGAVQRRDYGVLAPFLPPKHEYVLFITLTDVQVKLYQHYLDNYSRRPLPGKSSGFLFPDFQSLQRIWTHPLVLKYNSERYEIMQQKKRDREEEDSEGSLVDFIDDDSTPDETSSEDESDSLSDLSDDSRKKSKKKKSAKKGKTKENKGGARRGTRANPRELEEEPAVELVEAKSENPTEWWIPLVSDEEVEDMRNSHKLVLLFEILRQCEAIGDKLLVFSQSLYSLDLIEHFLGKVDEATQEGRIDEKLGGHVGSWSPGIDYFRLDGSTSCENRSIWCKNFNREDNPRARLFLISTRAGGLGINLVAANRVVIFDVSWNPSHDVQSIFRVYRFGQKKPCYVYRFLAMGTMEEKIYERQVTKQAISKRVIDEQQIDRHYAENDLAELYKFEPRPPEPRPVPLVPRDRFFAEMLKDHERAIYKFHEHDSLLENKEEETLSEEERKAAWDDFENEKNRPPPAPFPNWPMHNGMVPNLMAQQQQQLAYAALSAMLRKDMPNLTDDSIRSMLPLIYGANPGLMQKLSDMYKYTQPGMMNPAMMNPVMNPSGLGGVGGASGLQYEPPWQRQQQQQQQMRLQQLMQHQQNAMGAKFYAGGLGSRDPVAMALQQQRAREIMLSGAGRPRGRPPLAARPPPATDVVDLDSD